MQSLRLKYITDNIPGISRLKSGAGFNYSSVHGKRITEASILERIRLLVIPPAWTKVWICPFENGHLQATGRDARGRKQYRYHSGFRKHQDGSKFAHITAFALSLPKIRRRVGQDLEKPGLPREKVIATVVRLLERTLIRVGNQEYAEQNHSFGLSTLQNKHVKHCGQGVRFTFIGKSGVQHDVEVADPKLARIIFRCHDLPGQHLFEYLDENRKTHSISSSDVNEYIHDATNAEFSAKSFRTWKGTVLAALAFERLESPAKKAGAVRMMAKVVKDVSMELRNTPATCRKYYIHPRLFDLYERGLLAKSMETARSKTRHGPVKGLSHDEQAVLEMLKPAG